MCLKNNQLFNLNVRHVAAPQYKRNQDIKTYIMLFCNNPTCPAGTRLEFRIENHRSGWHLDSIKVQSVSDIYQTCGMKIPTNSNRELACHATSEQSERV